MENEKALPERKHPRLKTYDYSRNGMYFVTICTKDKACILSRITEDGKNVLSGLGLETEAQIKNIPKRFNGFEIANYVIMPNHVHLIFSIFQRPPLIRADEYTKKPTLCDAVGALKSLTSRVCWEKYGAKHIFQKSFHEHIIRSDKALALINEYINTNPQKWRKDCFFAE